MIVATKLLFAVIEIIALFSGIYLVSETIRSIYMCGAEIEDIIALIIGFALLLFAIATISGVLNWGTF